MKPHRATMILVFGILGFFCGPFGIAAWIMGSADLKEIAAGAMDPAGKDMTNIGRILGIVTTILMALGLLFGIAMTVLSGFAAAAASSAG